MTAALATGGVFASVRENGLRRFYHIRFSRCESIGLTQRQPCLRNCRRGQNRCQWTKFWRRRRSFSRFLL